MRVALLPTGRTEWHGLPIALQRRFPAHEFYGLPDEDVFRSTGPFDGFTSSTLTERHEGEYLPERARDLVERAAQEALGDGSRREAADVVVVIDDLELANQHQPGRAVRVFRRAVERHLEDLQGARTRTAHALRERVSFHLIVPMVEAWFFSDPQALRKAGVPAGVVPVLDNADLEDFLTTRDARYVGATETACPCWVTRGKKKADCPKWLGRHLRERHPKGYLQWLCHDGDAKNCTTYDESSGGAEALKGLDWGALLDAPGLRYLRALLEDLAHALGERAPMRSGGQPPPFTSLSGRPRNNVLRNL